MSHAEQSFCALDNLTTDVQPVSVPPDMAIPLASIVNELVTNIVKHVGPPCGVRLRSEVGNSLKLTISDTGQGPLQRQPSLGLGHALLTLFLSNLVLKWIQTGCHRVT